MTAGTTAPEDAQADRDHEVIDPPASLDHAIDPHGPESAGRDAVARAEQALRDLCEHFAGWMDDDLGALLAARDRARETGLGAHTRTALFHAAHDMKGQASTLGQPEAALVAASLCLLLEGVPDPLRIPGALIDQHVDGIRALVRERSRDGYDALARDLVERLAGVTAEFVDQELERTGLPPAGAD